MFQLIKHICLKHRFTDFLSLDCSAVFTTPTGVFTSPNYPNNYPNSRECIFRIIVEVNNQIMLNFTDFALESGTDCLFDYVEIR